MKKQVQNFEIKKGVELPKRQGGGSYPKYPWPDMKPGDMFFVPCDRHELISKRAALSSAAEHWFKRNGIKAKIQTRKMDGGIGVWRTE